MSIREVQGPLASAMGKKKDQMFGNLPDVAPKKRSKKRTAGTVRLRGPWTEGEFEDVTYDGDDFDELYRDAKKSMRGSGARGSMRKVKGPGGAVDRDTFMSYLGLD